MSENKRGHGLIVDEIGPNDYIWGSQVAAPVDELQPDGQWDAFLPEYEGQERNGLETMNCTSFGTLNALEALLYRKFGKRVNFSDRYLGIMAGTSRTGNSPHKVAEVIRKEAGCLEEPYLPFNDLVHTWEEYYSPNPMDPKLVRMGNAWGYAMNHDYVFYPNDNIKIKQAALREALRVSPCAVAVYAWHERDGVMVRPENERDNHWVMCYGYEEGKYWKVFDSYENRTKKMAWDYDFTMGKRYHIDVYVHVPWYKRFVLFIKSLFQ